VTDLRVVFDTNVLVSAMLFRRSGPRQARNIVRLRGLILLSESTFSELQEVLHRPKFGRYVTSDERRAFLLLVRGASPMVAVSEQIAVCRRSRDDKFLDAAVAGDATCIVTGDSDLLVLNPFRGIPILSPQAFPREHRLTD